MRLVIRLANAVTVAALLVSISLSAQVPVKRYQSAGVARMEGTTNQPGSVDPAIFMPSAASCPVSLRAQHGADGVMRKVDKTRPEGLAQRLHFTVASRDKKQIVVARLRVRGISGKGRVAQADTAPDSADATWNATVRFSQTGNDEATADLWVPGMTAVLQVEVSAVTFADGSVTRFSAADNCRFTPDHLMLAGSNSR